MQRSKKRGQVLVEFALVYSTLLLAVIASLVSMLMSSQYALARISTVGICELYAESPDIRGRWGGHIPYTGSRIPLPRMSVTVGRTTMGWDGRGIRLQPISMYDTSMPLSCTSDIHLRAISIPFLGDIEVHTTFTYTTNRRYGEWAFISPPRPSSPPVLFPLLLLPRRRNSGRRRGTALIEYALTSGPWIMFGVMAVEQMAETLDVFYAASLGQAAMGAAGLGPNRVPIGISFSVSSYSGGWGCSASDGEMLDCGVSPYSLGRIPTITITTPFYGRTLVVGEGG
ncbi:hypothetical protein [Thermogutta sp.]|uniref:hypothetical protein n=1 Tax=Thermogutta sp. TaxID=1962930 RepID=UPI00322007EA